MTYTFNSTGKTTGHPTPLAGTVTIPPSKSMAHRSFLAAAQATGTSHITNLVYSQDMEATLGAVAQMGGRVSREGDSLRLTGNGGQFPPVTAPVDCIESGSTLRFLIPLFTHWGQAVTFVGRGRLMERSQSVYQDLFREKGLEFCQSDGKITTAGAFSPGHYTLDGGVSSQFITGLLYLLPLLDGDSTLEILPPFESRSYVLLTVQTLADFGVNVAWEGENTLHIPGNQQFSPRDYQVEGDCSQAAFFAVLGAVVGEISLTGLRADSQQGDRVIFQILERAGGKLTPIPGGYQLEKSNLTGVTIDLADCPDLGPILMVMGLFAQGETKIINAGRLRDKESDRIATMVEEITKLGGQISVEGDTVTITGSSGGKALTGGVTLSSHNDHRVAMALTVACLGAGISAELTGAEAVNKSFPHFFQVIESLQG